jgi:hypothetical protein
MAADVNKNEELEMLVLELGAEVYRIRTQMDEMSGVHTNFLEMIKNLKQILDDKGLINSDDFDEAADWDKIQNSSSPHQQLEYATEEAFGKSKKNLH